MALRQARDGGENWVKAVGFEGIPWEDAPREDPPAIQGEIIVKAETPPENPDPDSLWIDKSVSPAALKAVGWKSVAGGWVYAAGNWGANGYGGFG